MALFGKQQATPLDGTDLVLADLDGVVYKGKSAVPHAVEALNSAAERMRVGYVTNNASRTATSVAQHLSDLGLTVVADDVVTSPQAAMSLLREAAPAGSTILVVGGEGLESEVLKAGYTITKTADDKPAAVIQGFHPTVAWTDLAQASFALHTGIPWIATNMDWTIPVDGGIAPGNGTLVSAVHTAVGRLPDVAGKPEVPIFEEAIRRFGASNALFIGDRLDTDILGGNRAGLRTALVLTGIDQAKQVLAAPKGSRPTYILPDLRSLTEPYPETVLSKDGSKATVGKASVRITGYQVEVVNEGNDELNLLRAASAVIWNSSTKIYGLQVPESLYS